MAVVYNYNAGPTYTKIASQTLASAAASVTFSSIPQGYTDLIVVFNGSGNGLANYFMQVGNDSIDTGNSYSTTVLDGDGSSVYSARYTNDTVGVRADYWATASSNMKQTIFQIQNYSNTTTYKTVLMRSSLPANETVATVGLWRSTSAINTLKIYPISSNFNTGSTFSIYGVAAALKPKATGGTVTFDPATSKWVHTFTSSGVFTPTQGLTADYLVVAGGGGSDIGGGGAGGLRSTVTATGGGGSLESALSLTTQAYTVTVGAGGGVGSNGNNSVFSTITSTGGGAGRGNNTNGNSGGSGGGGGYGTSSGGTASPSGQGYAGGAGAATSGGGGGGAGAAGANSAASNTGGAGGNGVAVSITGSSVTYGGGGGGAGSSSGGAAGSGGGGAGSSTSGGNGTANRGGGGGGGWSVAAASGGSGIVIVRYSA
jgi:hypothetical protein